MAKANPFRFSTKYQDDETDLLYYGRRFYSLNTGRWLSNDPIGEDGGENLYAVWKNDFVNKFDLFGLCPCSASMGEVSGTGRAGGAGAAAACRSAIEAVKKNGPPKELPDDNSCSQCPKDLADALKNPNYILKGLLDQFGKDCPLPPIRCARCSGAGGWYDPNKPEIVVCHQDSASMPPPIGNWISTVLTHELTHALQACQKKGKGCKGSLQSEMQAYFCSREAVDFGDNYLMAVGSSCGVSPSKCTPDEVKNLYQEMQEWFNKQKSNPNFCTFPTGPDHPTPR